METDSKECVRLRRISANLNVMVLVIASFLWVISMGLVLKGKTNKAPPPPSKVVVVVVVVDPKLLSSSLLYSQCQVKTGNVHFCIFFGHCPCPESEIMKFCRNRRCDRKTGKALNSQQLKYSTQMKIRESLNFAFLISQLCKNGHSLFFSWGDSNVFSHTYSYNLAISEVGRL